MSLNEVICEQGTTRGIDCRADEQDDGCFECLAAE